MRILYLGVSPDDFPILSRYIRQGPDVMISQVIVHPSEELAPASFGKADVLVMSPTVGTEAQRMAICDAVLSPT